MIKPLLPTLREKKRYLFVQAIADQEIPQKSLLEAVKQGMKDYTGSKGLAEAGLKPVKADIPKNQAIVRISNKSVNQVKASLTCIHTINSIPVIIASKGVAATLKTGLNKYGA